MIDYLLVCNYVEGYNIFTGKDSFFLEDELVWWLKSYDKEFDFYYKENFKNKQSLAEYCKEKIEKLINKNSEINILMNDNDLRLFVLTSVHDGRIGRIIQCDNNLIIEVDNESAMSLLKNFRIKLLNYEVITGNLDISHEKFVTVKKLSDLLERKKNVPLGCSSLVLKGDNKYICFEICEHGNLIIKFEKLLYEKKVFND